MPQDPTERMGHISGIQEMMREELKDIRADLKTMLEGNSPVCKQARRRADLLEVRIANNTERIDRNAGAIRFARWAAGLIVGGGGATGIGAGIKAWLEGAGQ